MRELFPAIIVIAVANGVVDPKPIASMGRAERLAMSFGRGWSLKNYENNKPW
jgi:hypothetical protein